MQKISVLLSVFFVIVILSNCKDSSSNEIVIPEEPHQFLSEYNFFKGELSLLQPNEGVIPYDLNSPLFSDYAEKARFVWMPDGSSAQYTIDHVLDFPKGTALIKNFYYYNDARHPESGRKIIETRLLLNQGEEWEAVSYIWNDDQSDAYHEIIGDIKDVAWVNEAGESMRINYIIPNKNQCKSCHAYDNELLPIGPKVQNLNKDFEYDVVMNQLQKWTDVGYLKGYDHQQMHPVVANWKEDHSSNLEDQALAYLDINCGHCHNPKGAGQTSGLTLLADSQVGLQLGVYKATVSAGAGTGGHTYSIVPGQPEKSILLYRMKSTEPGAMMPELGRSIVHEEGIQLISDWIANMNPDMHTAPSQSSLN